jgi:hypothetical protein
MKRMISATCLAAAFAVGLSAQSTGTAGTVTQDPPAGGGQGRGGGPRTATGCLRAGETAGTYVLADVTMQGGGGRRVGDATTGGTTTGTGTTAGTATGAGTTAGTGGAGTTASGGQGRGGGAVQTLMLTADASVDLKPHVGHKVEVTGTMAGGGGRRGGDTTAAGTATGTGAAAGTATGTTTGTTTGTGTGTGTTAQGGGRAGTRTMNVTALKMIANSCS